MPIGSEKATPDRLGVHGFALAIVLFCFLAFVGVAAPWSADVGAQLFQADAVAAGESWSVQHPFPEVDPEGTAFPLHLSFRSADRAGYVPFGKHVASTWAIAGMQSLGGFGAVVALSVLGTVAAATGVGRLARILHPRSATTALWLTGLGSPLLFDAFLGYAHTIAAGGLAWGAYGALSWVTEPRPQALSGSLGLSGALLLLASIGLVRTEAPIAGLALGIGLAAAAVTPGLDRAIRRRWLIASVLVAAASIGGAVVDRLNAIPVTGPVVDDDSDQLWGFWDGRLAALANTWLRPGNLPADHLLLVAAILILAGGAILWIETQEPTRPSVAERPKRLGLVRFCWFGALACVVGRGALSPRPLVAGLVIAMPLLFVGLLFAQRRGAARPGPTLRALTVGFWVFCLAVLATEYPYGGVAEWGGRYFAVGLPLGIAPAALGLTRAAALVPRPQRSRLGLALVAMTLALNAQGLLGLRDKRATAAETATSLSRAIEAQPTGAASEPVVVSTAPLAPRLAWDRLDEARWLLISDAEIPRYAARLAANHVDAVTFVAFSGQLDVHAFAPHYAPTPAQPVTVGSLGIVNLARADN